jgi:hypothetical protein
MKLSISIANYNCRDFVGAAIETYAQAQQLASAAMSEGRIGLRFAPKVVSTLTAAGAKTGLVSLPRI